MSSIAETVARAMCPYVFGSREDARGNDLPDEQYDDISSDWQARLLAMAQSTDAALKAAGYALVRKDALPDYIETYRIINGAGRSDRAKALAIDTVIRAAQGEG